MHEDDGDRVGEDVGPERDQETVGGIRPHPRPGASRGARRLTESSKQRGSFICKPVQDPGHLARSNLGELLPRTPGRLEQPAVESGEGIGLAACGGVQGPQTHATEERLHQVAPAVVHAEDEHTLDGPLVGRAPALSRSSGAVLEHVSRLSPRRSTA